MPVTLREFVLIGRLGDIQMGLTPDQVVRIIGEPEDRSVKKRPVQILRYGAVELSFQSVKNSPDCRLVGAAIYFYDPARAIPAVLQPADWTPSNQSTMQQVRAHLETSGIPVQPNVNGEQEYLFVSSGASFVFDEGRLHSIHFRQKDNSAERKQMTVSLPREAVEKLKHRAQEEGLSVNDLIERMILAGT